MVPQRRPTTSSPSTRERETFTWPPPTDEIDAMEVIVLDDPPPAPRPRTRKVDVAHWGLTLASLLAIAVAMVMQFANWRGMPDVPQDAAVAGAAVAAAAPIAAAPAVAGPAVSLIPAAVAAPMVPPPDRTVARPAAFVPIRKPRPRERQARVAIDSPPLRLPESYVQPRLISSGYGGRVRGKVVLGVQVRANGRVGAVDVLSEDGDGDRNLERAAVAAVKQWRYRPALRDGVPTPARLKVIVKFS